VNLLVRQITSALFLMIGLIASMSWFYWNDSPFWLLILGSTLVLTGIVSVVFNIVKAEEDLAND